MVINKNSIYIFFKIRPVIHVKAAVLWKIILDVPLNTVDEPAHTIKAGSNFVQLNCIMVTIGWIDEINKHED